jgi:hypothetical protein
LDVTFGDRCSFIRHKVVVLVSQIKQLARGKGVDCLISLVKGCMKLDPLIMPALSFSLSIISILPHPRVERGGAGYSRKTHSAKACEFLLLDELSKEAN